MSTEEQIRALIRPEVLELSAYKTVDPGDCIKLDAMENPYSWPKPMTEAWLDRLRMASINRYPDPAAVDLKAALYKYQAIPGGKELLLGNGSDEIIQIILTAIAGDGAVVMAPEPTFVMYRQIAITLGLKFEGVPLDPVDFSLDGQAMAAAIERHRPAVIFLAYPNNPTGNLFDRGTIKEIVKLAPGLVVIDEAYAPFTESSFLDQLDLYENLLIMRTVSKLGLAGLRLGYLVGARLWIEQFEKVRLPYNINVLSQFSAEFALANHSVFEAQAKQIRRDRETLFRQLVAIDCIDPLPSEANFILFRLKHPLIGSDELFCKLKDAGVLIKNMNGSSPHLSGCLRVTVGDQEENSLFMTRLTEMLV